MKKIFCLFCAFLSFYQISFAQKSKFDPRIENILAELKFKYEQNPVNGDYTFELKINNRKQNVFVQSTTSSYQNLEMREVYSVIYRNEKSPNLETLQSLMIDTSHKHLGAWELAFENDIYFIVFNAKVNANMNVKELQDTIRLVALSADEMENKLFAQDGF